MKTLSLPCGVVLSTRTGVGTMSGAEQVSSPWLGEELLSTGYE